MSHLVTFFPECNSSALSQSLSPFVLVPIDRLGSLGAWGWGRMTKRQVNSSPVWVLFGGGRHNAESHLGAGRGAWDYLDGWGSLLMQRRTKKRFVHGSDPQ